MNTKRLTMAQAIIAFLKNQYVERDGKEQPFFAGCFGIFGHGNVAGIGQALHENHSMIRLAQRLGFRIAQSPDTDTVTMSLRLQDEAATVDATARETTAS